MSGQTITVSVLADTKKFSRAMKNLGNETGFTKLAKAARTVGIAVAAGVGAAIVGVAALGTALVKAGERASTSNARIANIAQQMSLFGDQAGVVSDRLVALANKQARATGVDQNAIKATQAKLLTFKELAKSADQVGGMFDRTTKAAVDLAAAGFGSAEENATQLGKALNDPIHGLSALTRSGITFTEQQKEQIRVMQEAGDIAGAQEMIMAAIEQQVGGTAEATANFTDRIKVVWSQANEYLGQKLLPLFNAVAAFVIDRMVPAFQAFASQALDYLKPKLDAMAQWFKDEGLPAIKKFSEYVKSDVLPRLKQLAEWLKTNVIPRIQQLAKWITGSLVPALVKFGQWVVRNKDWLTALAVVVGVIVAGIKTYTIALATWKAATAAASVVQAAFNAVMAANPIGIIVLAIAALVAGLVYFFTQTDTGKAIWEEFTTALSDGWEWIKDAFQTGYEAVSEWLGKVWDFIKQVWEYTPLGLIVGHWDDIKGAFKSGYDSVKSWMQKVWDFIKQVWEYTPLGAIITNWTEILDFFKSIPGKIGDFFKGVGDTLTAPFKKAFNKIADYWNKTVGKVSFTAPDWIPGIGGKGWSIPKIPMLASGGILTSPTLFLGGEAGAEAVIPLSRLDDMLGGGRGDVTINVQITAGVGDPISIGREVSRVLNAYERASGGRR